MPDPLGRLSPEEQVIDELRAKNAKLKADVQALSAQIIALDTARKLGTLAKLTAIVEPIEELRAEEGSSILIVNDNPDFGGPPCLIQVCGLWAGLWRKHIRGDNLADCLRRAVEMKREAEKEKTSG